MKDISQIERFLAAAVCSTTVPNVWSNTRRVAYEEMEFGDERYYMLYMLGAAVFYAI